MSIIADTPLKDSGASGYGRCGPPTIRDHILAGHCYRHALNTRTFEPDGPNYTPRISGVVKPDGNPVAALFAAAHDEVCDDGAFIIRGAAGHDAPAGGTTASTSTSGPWNTG